MRADGPNHQTYGTYAHVAFMLKCILYLRDMLPLRGKLSPENQKHVEMEGLLVLKMRECFFQSLPVGKVTWGCWACTLPEFVQELEPSKQSANHDIKDFKKAT